MDKHIIHGSARAINDPALLKVKAIDIPYRQYLDSLYEIDDGVEELDDGGIKWHNKITEWDGDYGISPYISGFHQSIDDNEKLNGIPTIEFIKNDYYDNTCMLVPASNQVLFRNPSYLSNPRKPVVCLVCKAYFPMGITTKYLLNAAAGYGYTPGSFSIFDITAKKTRIIVGTCPSYNNFDGAGVDYPEGIHSEQWNIIICEYDMNAGCMKLYINGIKLYDDSFPVAMSLTGAAYPHRAGIGDTAPFSMGTVFTGHYAALAIWNHNLTTDEQFFLDVTNYFRMKYGIEQ